MYICIKQEHIFMSNPSAVTKDVTKSKSADALVKPLHKKASLNLVKITAEEINASRPSVYKYLLP